jgi:hypothetical protein
MAWHDFWCQLCGQVLVNVDVPAAIGARLGAPLHCGQPTSWLPAVGRMDASSGPGFEAFDAYDGQNRPVRVDSLKKLRDIERQSEVDARNGLGQPIVWRRFSQDRSNHDVHSLAPTFHQERPDPAYVKKFAPAIKRDGAEAPDAAYGPGISDATPSALDTLDWKG